MVIFKLLICLAILGTVCEAKKIRYVTAEHPKVTWYNPKYARSMNLTSRRYSRADPLYYVGFHVDSIWPIHNNINVDYYFYEYLSNQYKLSFPHLHFSLCDVIAKDLFFGISFGQFVLHPCPLEPGIYHFVNITVPFKNIPENLPYSKGRLQVNFTSTDTHELLGRLHLDGEIKTINTRRVNKRQRRNL